MMNFKKGKCNVSTTYKVPIMCFAKKHVIVVLQNVVGE